MGACCKEEPLQDNSKGRTHLTLPPSKLTNDVLVCKGKGSSGRPVSIERQTFLKQKESSLENVFL
jgi:hypothetical protein